MDSEYLYIAIILQTRQVAIVELGVLYQSCILSRKGDENGFRLGNLQQLTLKTEN